ncbi:MAG: hypothetical protein JWL59_3417 [Chthoniobacteraceae bacterium]|nr:hypothetical protein [Chthoniobacteraceae bacterium]
MNFADQLHILKGAQGDSALLVLATAEIAHHALPKADQARIKEALLAAAVPHWFDRYMLAALLATTPENCDYLIPFLRALTIIEPFPARGEDALNVHESARLALREHLRTTEPERWKTLSERARTYVSCNEEPHAKIEALYHLFATDQPAAAIECQALDLRFHHEGQTETIHALALSLSELANAGWLTGSAQVEASLVPLEVRASRDEATKLEDAINEVLKIACVASYPYGIVRAKSLLANVLIGKGYSEAAFKAIEEELVICHAEILSEPSNLEWLRILSFAYCALSDICKSRGRNADALTYLQEALIVGQKLAATESTDTFWQQRHLASIYLKLGNLWVTKGLLDNAWEAFCNCSKIFTSIMIEASGNQKWQFELALVKSHIINISAKRFNLSEALTVSRQALISLEEVACADVSNTALQASLSDAYANVGDTLLRQGCDYQNRGFTEHAKELLDEALITIHKSLSISAHLATLTPSNIFLQYRLAVDQSKLAGVHELQGALDAALTNFYKSLAIFQQLSATDPSNIHMLRELAATQSKICNIHRLHGRFDEALLICSESLAHLKYLTNHHPGYVICQRDLAIAHLNRARIYRDIQCGGKAQSSFRWCIKTMEKAVSLSPKDTEWRRDLALIRKESKK